MLQCLFPGEPGVTFLERVLVRISAIYKMRMTHVWRGTIILTYEYDLIDTTRGGGTKLPGLYMSFIDDRTSDGHPGNIYFSAKRLSAGLLDKECTQYLASNTQNTKNTGSRA